MIEKISNIHYKSFDNFDCSHIAFSTINVIYGLNGKGKSTFVKFLQQHIANTEEYKHCKVFLYNDEYRYNTITASEDNKTLTSFYVGENIKQLITKRKRQLEKQKKFSNLQEELNSSKNTCESNLQKLYTTIAKHTKIVLKEMKPSKYFTDKSYTKQDIIKLLGSKQLDDFKLLSDQEYDKAKNHKESKQYYQITIPSNPLKDLQIYSKVEQLLKKTIQKETIQRLSDDMFLSQWVGQALQIYRNKPQYENECPLCSQKITKEFWERLEKHFNQEYERLVADISRTQTQLDTVMGELANYKHWIQTTLVSNTLLASFEKTSIDEVRKLLDDNICGLMEEITDLKTLLQEKKDNIDKVDFSINCNIGLHDFKNSKYESLKKLIEIHNKRQGDYQKTINDNIALIQDHFIAGEREELEKLLFEHRKLTLQITKCQRIVEKINKKIANLMNELQMNGGGLNYLNGSLNAFFDDIRFIQNNDGSYRVQRLDTKGEWFDCIEGLSEGEKTIVSMVYFIEYYCSKKALLGNATILCIDDPITSLDSENKSKILGFICKKIKNFAKQQIFFSSHDKDTLRGFEDYFENPSSHEGKRIKVFFEIKKISNHSKLEEIGKSKLFSVDTMFKLFKYLQDFVDEENPTEEQIRNIGNQARQLIEKVFSIVLRKRDTFARDWDNLLKMLDKMSFYSATDIHNFSHNNHENKNYDELQNIAKSILEVLSDFNYTKNSIIPS